MSRRSSRRTRRGGVDDLPSRYLAAIALLGCGLLGTAAAPVLPAAMLAFAVAGMGRKW